VQRELAVFEAEGKEFQVHLSLKAAPATVSASTVPALDVTAANGTALTEKTKQNDNDDQMDDESNGPGLFEKWYGNNLGASLRNLEEAAKLRDKSQNSSDDIGYNTVKEKTKNENSRSESSNNDGQNSENAINSQD
jgi:hypothetical protein